MAKMPAPTAQTRRLAKGERIALRASQEQRDLIGRASEATSTTVSDFVLRASIARAEEVLADRREFRLPPDRWNAFVDMLDRPPVEKPRLRSFLTEPSILER
ncbi:MAG: DUF1778 domain-containing protein [Chloroflexota bacterium]